MWKSHIKPGSEYALREKRGPDVPLQRVRIIEHIRGNKWKAEWIEPNPKLIHFVESGHLLVPWKDRTAFLQEEAAAVAIQEHNERHGYRRDSPLDRAVGQIFESSGEKDISYWRGELTGVPDAIDRFV